MKENLEIPVPERLVMSHQEYIYIYTCLYIYVYIFIYIYMYIWMYMYIYIYQILLKTLYQKFGYVIELVTFIYIPWIVMFLGFIIRYSPSANFISLLFYRLLTFLEKNIPIPPSLPPPSPRHFLKNKKNFYSHPFRKVGEIQLRLIKTTCFTHFLLILIQQYENTSGYGTRGYMLQKKRIGR